MPFCWVTETYQTLETSRILVQDALESHRLSRERYEAGAGTITELLDAQTALARAEATRVDPMGLPDRPGPIPARHRPIRVAVRRTHGKKNCPFPVRSADG